MCFTTFKFTPTRSQRTQLGPREEVHAHHPAKLRTLFSLNYLTLKLHRANGDLYTTIFFRICRLISLSLSLSSLSPELLVTRLVSRCERLCPHRVSILRESAIVRQEWRRVAFSNAVRVSCTCTHTGFYMKMSNFTGNELLIHRRFSWFPSYLSGSCFCFVFVSHPDLGHEPNGRAGTEKQIEEVHVYVRLHARTIIHTPNTRECMHVHRTARCICTTECHTYQRM